MKRIAIFLIICASTLFANYSDGFITPEDGYLFGVTWSSYDPPLVVDGGGAYDISVGENGRLIVESTSTPLERYVSGVYDILLFDESQLLYEDGVTEYIRLTQDNTATLKGGSINLIGTLRYAAPALGDENIFIYAQDGWSWLDGNPLFGIEGLWLDDTPFQIEFDNDPDYDPVWMSVKVIPEPATLALLAFGGLLLRKRSS